jgi:hypothetical protein
VKNKKKVQDALHDAVATDDDDVECPTPIDKEPEPGQPKALPFTQEMTPDRLDAITVMDTEIEETSPDVGFAVAIGHNSPFAIADKKMKIHTSTMVMNPPFPKWQPTMMGCRMWIFLVKNRQDLWNLNHRYLNQQRVSRKHAFLSCIVFSSQSPADGRLRCDWINVCFHLKHPSTDD